MRAARSRPKSPVFLLAAITLSLAMLFGGGQGHLGDTLTQLSALTLLGALLWRQPDLRGWPKASLWLLVLFVPLLLFLLPWPEALRGAGAARGQLLQSLQPILGRLPWPGSLNPIGTERAAFWLLPAAALFLATLQMPQAQQRKLVTVMVVWLFIGAILGLAQKFDGAESTLYFYSNTNRGMAVGLFANNNHYAIAMVSALPLVWASLVWRFNLRGTAHSHPLWFVLVGGMALVFIIGFMLSGSRAGLVLGMLGCLLMLPAIIAADQHQGAKHWLFAAMAVGLVLSIQLGLYFIVLQFAPDPLLDGRWQINAASRETAVAFAPAGAGPGAFFYAFQHIDGLLFGPLNVNHAHNDFLELWLESRWLAALPGATLLLAFVWQGARVWIRSGAYSVHAVLLARAAWVGLLLLIVHSAVDYPLRTTAISAMAGLLAALVMLPESERLAEAVKD
jgi:O-antigen ligase